MTRFIPMIVLTLALIVGGGFWLTQQGPSNEPGAELVLPGAANAQEAASDAESVEIKEMILGDPEAPVEVIEYASYTCPHCANFHNGVFKDLKADYIDTGKIKFVYREVYFDKYGMWASMIARCSGPEKFFGITDLVYKTQDTWLRAGSDATIADELRKIGRLAGIGDDSLEACLTDANKLRGLVEWFQVNVEEHNVRATPTFVINGATHSNMNYTDFAALIDAELAN